MTGFFRHRTRFNSDDGAAACRQTHGTHANVGQMGHQMVVYFKRTAVVSRQTKSCICSCSPGSNLCACIHPNARDLFVSIQNVGMKRDIEWWRSLLPTWDGVYFFDFPAWAPIPDFFISTDVSGRNGYSAFYAGEWFNGPWSIFQ